MCHLAEVSFHKMISMTYLLVLKNESCFTENYNNVTLLWPGPKDTRYWIKAGTFTKFSCQNQSHSNFTRVKSFVWFCLTSSLWTWRNYYTLYVIVHFPHSDFYINSRKYCKYNIGTLIFRQIAKLCMLCLNLTLFKSINMENWTVYVGFLPPIPHYFAPKLPRKLKYSIVKELTGELQEHLQYAPHSSEQSPKRYHWIRKQAESQNLTIFTVGKLKYQTPIRATGTS